MKRYGYVRVSTDKQEHGPAAQKAAIVRAVGDVDEWFEEHESGKNVTGRPVLQDVLNRVCDEQALLVVAKLDRIGRSTVDVLQIFERVHECGAAINVVDFGIDTTTPAGKMMLTMLAAFAEFEREMISQRTKDGLAAARAKGVLLGRPSEYDHAVKVGLARGLTVKQIADLNGCSVRTVQRIKSRMA